MLNKLPASTTQFDFIALRGGLDLLTPTLQLKPGYARDAINWEQSVNGGYSRILGYEAYDGQTSPSSAIYLTITADITGTIVVGNTIEGGTSGATGVVTSITASGDEWVIAFTKSTGSFEAGEDIEVSSVVQGEVTDLGGSIDEEEWSLQQTSLAAAVYRADITAVPGSGPVRGVARYNGVVYAWRNNAGGTALEMYRSSGSGWVLVPMLFEVAFTAGTSEYVAGETLTQGGVSATIRVVALEDGDWTGSAVGRMLISAPTGGNFAAGASVGGGGATLSGVQTAVSFLPGGKIETDIGNFGPGPMLYGVDGVNRAWQFDGTYLMPINTGNSPDVPHHGLAHQDHLFLSFGPSLQHSGIGFPFDWTVTGGAGEMLCSSNVNGLLRLPGEQSAGAMYVGLADSTDILYGSSPTDFRKVPFVDSVGAAAYTPRRIGGQVMVMENGGVFSLSASQAYGNFAPASITMNIRPWIQARRNIATAAVVNREKSQYRVFFSDGYGLYLTVVNGKLAGSMPVQFPNPVLCACDGDTPDSNETAFFGSDDGFVYRLDAGPSFDGDPIEHYLTLAFASQGNTRVRKRYRKAVLELKGDGQAGFGVTHEIGYGASNRIQGSTARDVSIALQTAYWDEFTWDSFTWDGRSLSPSEVQLGGTAENISITVFGSSELYMPYTINSVTLHYAPRRLMR